MSLLWAVFGSYSFAVHVSVIHVVESSAFKLLWLSEDPHSIVCSVVLHSFNAIYWCNYDMDRVTGTTGDICTMVKKTNCLLSVFFAACSSWLGDHIYVFVTPRCIVYVSRWPFLHDFLCCLLFQQFQLLFPMSDHQTLKLAGAFCEVLLWPGPSFLSSPRNRVVSPSTCALS